MQAGELWSVRSREVLCLSMESVRQLLKDCPEFLLASHTGEAQFMFTFAELQRGAPAERFAPAATLVPLPF